MRVIAGEYKSRPLRTLAGMKTRPTGDRLRETLFNVLTAGDPGALTGSRWLDLFAGTGAVGIEALSRGASHVTFVDSSKTAAKVIRENLKSLGVRAGFEVLDLEAARALRQIEVKSDTVEYVFIDPPYADHELYSKMLGLLGELGVLKEKAMVIVEHDKRFDPGEEFGSLRRYRTLVQGDSGLSFYRKN
jgi:16S rRNA (guanine966-N2)-methyltransferase